MDSKCKPHPNFAGVKAELKVSVHRQFKVKIHCLIPKPQIASNERTLTKIHRVNPTAIMRQPTALSARSDSEVPTKKSARIMPRRAISEIAGNHRVMSGT